MSRYHHNKVTHELEPVSGFGSRVATSVDGKTLTVHSSILNIDGYNYGQGDIGAYVEMIAPIETGLVATKDYDIGDSFVYGAQLYVVTSPIEEDEAIVIGTNCELSDSVSEIVTSADLKADAVSDQLEVSGTKFYFDSHDGKYGYNTSAARGADTFVPFRRGAEINYNIVTCHFPNTYNCTFYKWELGVVTTYNIAMYNANTLVNDDNVTIASNAGGRSFTVTAKKNLVVIYDVASSGQAVKTTASTATVYNLSPGESVTLSTDPTLLTSTIVSVYD